MTRDDAIKILKELPNSIFGIALPFDTGFDYTQALDMAIKALEQEPCEDAVSRNQVVEWLQRASDDSIQHAIDSNLKFMPPITPTRKKGKWIPCSERLPKKTGWYLITFKVYGGDYAVCEMSYRKPENYWIQNDIGKKILDNDEVVAWMPLPEPYKAESEV